MDFQSQVGTVHSTFIYFLTILLHLLELISDVFPFWEVKLNQFSQIVTGQRLHQGEASNQPYNEAKPSNWAEGVASMVWITSRGSEQELSERLQTQ